MPASKCKDKTENATLKTVNNRMYLVKSVFVGDKDLKTLLIKIAEKKTVNEMGLNYSAI